MGNLAGQSDQQLTESLQGEYQVEAHPYLLHRSTNQLCTLHKITTNSAPNSHRIQEIITEYDRTRCESISKLKAHYLLDKRGVCSDEEHYFLVFRGQNSYSLKDETIKRRFYQKPFREEEIRQVVQTYLCGLREYSQRFQREYYKLGLDSLAIDTHSKRIYLKDPWLGAATDPEHPDNLSQLMQSYPSPEKISAAQSPKVVPFNEFLSNLFSVGVISLQLKRLEFADTIYTKKREVNVEDIRGRLTQFRDGKLRRGVELLLDLEPSKRKEVYMIWGIENREEHYLVPITEEKEGHRISQGQYLEPPQRGPLQKVSMVPPPNYPPVSLRPELNPPQVHPKQVESIYIPAPQGHQRTKTPAQVHFEHPQTTRANPPNYTQQNRQYETRFEDRRVEPVRSFVSFKDYFNQEEPKTTQPLTIPTTTSNTIQFQQKYNPEIRTSRTNHSSQGQSPIQPNYIDNYALSGETSTKPASNEHITLKKEEKKREESTLANPLDILKKNQETVGKIAKEVSQASKDNEGREKDISPVVTKTAPHSKEISPIKDESPLQEVKSSGQTSSSPSKPPSKPNSNPNITEEDTFFLKQEVGSEEKETTPKRKTQKNRYNSTIVEVRDEDTPDHSAVSDEGLEEEYVVEEYDTGSRYEGFKSGGMRNGRGRFYYQDGGYYEGQWKNNKMNGYGKLYYEGGKIAYEGQWTQDEFNGLGKVYNDSPVAFQGNFDYTNFDYLQDYWQYYQGMLSHDTKEGRGRIKLSNGQFFEGDFHEDKIQGFGKFHTTEGKTIEGIWRQSKLIKIISN